MNYKTKKVIREKATLLYGLLNVLKDDIDMLRSDANVYDIENLNGSVRDTVETLEKMTDAVGELEYYLYLEKHNAKRP